MLYGESYLLIKAMFLFQNKSIIYHYRQIRYVRKYAYNKHTYRAYQYFTLMIDTIVLCYFNAPLPKVIIAISYQD